MPPALRLVLDWHLDGPFGGSDPFPATVDALEQALGPARRSAPRWPSPRSGLDWTRNGHGGTEGAWQPTGG